MAPEDEAALECEEEVLADGLDPLEAPAIKQLDEPESRGARMRRLDPDDLARKPPDALGRATEAVALGHDGSLASPAWQTTGRASPARSYARSTARRGPARKPASTRSDMTSVSATGRPSKRSTAIRFAP